MTDFFTAVQTRQHEKNTRICLGLDPDFRNPQFKSNPQAVLDWATALIEKTAPEICCVKPQAAFFYALKADITADIAEIAHAHELPVILDHKHNDIGSTAAAYAFGSFDQRKADAITVNAYLGADSVKPFADYTDKGVFILARTSNPSSQDFQNLDIGGTPLYVHLAETAKSWGNNIGLVVGATQPEAMQHIRAISDAWFLAPGLGAQGGDAASAMKAAARNIIFPVSRGIAEADDPAKSARNFRDLINKS